MNKFMNVLEKYLTPFSQMVASNQLLQSIKDAFILGIPFTVVGSICGLIKSQLEYWLTQAGVSLDGLLGSIIHVLGNVGTVAMGLMGIVIVLSSSYFYAQRLKENNNKVVPLMTSLLALVSYFATIPWELVGESETLSGFMKECLLDYLLVYQQHGYIQNLLNLNLQSNYLIQYLQEF